MGEEFIPVKHCRSWSNLYFFLVIIQSKPWETLFFCSILILYFIFSYLPWLSEFHPYENLKYNKSIEQKNKVSQGLLWIIIKLKNTSYFNSCSALQGWILLPILPPFTYQCSILGSFVSQLCYWLLDFLWLGLPYSWLLT